MPPQGDHHGLVLGVEHGGLGLLRPGGQVLEGAAVAPFGDSRRIDAVAVARLSGLLDDAVSLDGSPLSLWLRQGEPDPNRVLPLMREDCTNKS